MSYEVELFVAKLSSSWQLQLNWVSLNITIPTNTTHPSGVSKQADSARNKQNLLANKTYLTNQTQLNLTCPELGTAQPQLVYIFLSEIYGASLWRCYMVWSRWQTSIGWLEHERSCGVAVCMTRCQLKSTGVREERKRWWRVVFRSPCMNAEATGTRGGPGFRDRTQAEKMPENDFFVGKK